MGVSKRKGVGDKCEVCLAKDNSYYYGPIAQ